MIEAAIVGLGWWGRTLVDAVQKPGSPQSASLRFVAAHTRSRAKAEEFAASRGMKLLDSYEDVLHRREIEAVVLATPHSLHASQILQAAAAGKHVFVEKPLTLTAADAHRAAEACRRAEAVLAVGFNRRFLPGFEALVDTVISGKLGDILHIEGTFSGPMGRRYADHNWRGHAEESPAGGMTGLGVHILDAMISLCGEVGELHAYSLRQVLSGELDDTTSVHLRFREGMTGHLATMTATGMLYRIHVFGSEGWSEFRSSAARPNRLQTVLLEYPPTNQEFADVSAERLELENFADAVAGIEPFRVPVREAVHNVEVLEAIQRSAGAKAIVKLGE